MEQHKYTLPNMEFPFKIQIIGDETGVNWHGDFKYARPTLGARGRIAAMRSQLNGDLENLDDPEVMDFHHMISYLRHTLSEAPKWWKEALYGSELHDVNVVNDVYNRCMDFEAKWKERVHGGKSQDVQSGGDEHSSEKLVEDGVGEAQKQRQPSSDSNLES